MSPLLSDDIQTLSKAIKQAIKKDLDNASKEKAREGVAYYNYQNDILKQRIFYFDSNDVIREDKYASNVKIPHGFLTELVKQKTQFLLANPVEFNTDDEAFYNLLADYYNDDFQLLLQDLVSNGSQKGFEYAYARTDIADKLSFQVADGLSIIPVYDDNNAIVRLLRYYSQQIVSDGKTINLHYAELYDMQKVWYFVAENKQDYTLDTSRTPNPVAHVTAIADDGELFERNYGCLPFYRYQNNQEEQTDLEPVKAIIDDYDLMNAFLSNNLQDFQEAIYVVKGFSGDNLDTLRQNIKARKTVGVSPDGGLDIQTVDIPVDARKLKLDLDRENIYKFGMGFDSSQVGDGNITNVVIKGRYTLLNMKANEAETRLRAFLKWANEMVVADINRINETNYDPTKVEFTFTREMLVNENDLATNKKTEADTLNVTVQSIVAAQPYIGDDAVVKLLSDVFGLEPDVVQAQMDQQSYTPVPNLSGEVDGTTE